MEQEYYDALAKVRIDRAKELLDESIELLETAERKFNKKLMELQKKDKKHK